MHAMMTMQPGCSYAARHAAYTHHVHDKIHGRRATHNHLAAPKAKQTSSGSSIFLRSDMPRVTCLDVRVVEAKPQWIVAHRLLSAFTIP